VATANGSTVSQEKKDRWEDKVGSGLYYLAVIGFIGAAIIVEENVLHTSKELSGKIQFLGCGAIVLAILVGWVALQLADSLMRLLVWAILAVGLGFDCCAIYSIGRLWMIGLPGTSTDSLNSLGFFAIMALFLINLFCSFFILVLARAAGMSIKDLV
jgi:hypothetical protein